MDQPPPSIPPRAQHHSFRDALLAIAILAVTILVERLSGRLFIPASHRLLLFVPHADGPETSQQLADPYSFTHILHGILFYAVLRLLTRGRPWPVTRYFLAALVIECAWEAIENSSFIIDRYRHTAAMNYTGDTILNSLSDIAFAMFGVLLARRLPVRATVAVVVLIELTLAITIRDNLTLSALMLIHPFSGIKHWQSGG